jgi:D-alanyl-D-alanine carboxypeptidase
MSSEEIKKMQSKIGVVPDGFWGPKSQKACRDYLENLMPKPNPWPNSDQDSLRKFYGQPGDESNLVTVDFPFPTFYEGKVVKKFRCHKKVADSLLRVLKNINLKYGKNREIMEEAEDYGGVYNFRNKRGGTTFSVHAWGAAIDLDADDNTFRDSWPMKADMPLEIMEEFAKEGWLSAGAFWGYDAMHFQATK